MQVISWSHTEKYLERESDQNCAWSKNILACQLAPNNVHNLHAVDPANPTAGSLACFQSALHILIGHFKNINPVEMFKPRVPPPNLQFVQDLLPTSADIITQFHCFINENRSERNPAVTGIHGSSTSINTVESATSQSTLAHTHLGPALHFPDQSWADPTNWYCSRPKWPKISTVVATLVHLNRNGFVRELADFLFLSSPKKEHDFQCTLKKQKILWWFVTPSSSDIRSGQCVLFESSAGSRRGVPRYEPWRKVTS